MVSAWLLVTLTASCAVALGYGAVRLSRAPKAGRR
ncbi:hypothetical protein SAMN04515665_11165 [Blastococcus sp. DSM 46786]|nr:hypothetical protein SAMN04515665_11165 [Blastococcus sp. DSM 46786]